MINISILTSTVSGIDDIIIDYFNGLGWWGNLILIVLSLLAATLCGGLIGYQREINGHAAGFRTHILIGLGSALIMVLSAYAFGSSESTRDPMRLAAAGVTGIGFLGAGSIIKNGVTVKGLTTAASIWVTMAIGMCCGAGMFVIAAITTIITILCLVSFQKIETAISKKNMNILIIADMKNTDILKPLLELLAKYDIQYKNFDTSISEMDDEKILRIKFKCLTKKKDIVTLFMEEFKRTVNPISISII